MIETDSHGQPLEVDDLDAEWLLDFAHEAEAEVRRAERRRLRVVLRWCDLHPAVDDAHRLSWGEQERVWDCDAWIGGEGVPAVAEFSAQPLAAVMRMSPAATTSLMAEALELRHRLPKIHARVEALDVALWRARRVAKATQGLSPEAAAHVDAALAPVVDSVGPTRIDRAVAEAVALFDPETLEAAEEHARTREWGISLRHHRAGEGGQWAGTSWLGITGDTPTLQRLHDLIVDTTEPATGPDAELDPGLGERQVHALAAVLDGLGAPRPRVRLNIDVTTSDLDATGTGTETGVGQVLGLGPATLTKIREWLAGASVTVLPVLDMARTDSVDAHDPPRWMRDLVTRRDTHCVFPFCDVPASRCDLDHIEPYIDPDDGGPPGQTHPANLAPLCRHDHRAKTIDAWSYQRTDHGDYLWRDQHGNRYAVTPYGTLELDPGSPATPPR
ncbi:hypothetical protein I601_2459 [Nocardioides dokdonensis FR1436]|uniref:HNH nuclease domain-containing protein n=1 Tax=Nocardioides dokdonensis FR1436 TaxID=1300347 RepID=A0A1A9GKK6_9ACTN|nr:HNH endonuclease signature motif containing protein [Nocardioides dokdonensis]ANH38877.1 hypothetical protein I601_2459 [Nocardioides dokdonensis FR1436]